MWIIFFGHFQDNMLSFSIPVTEGYESDASILP